MTPGISLAFALLAAVFACLAIYSSRKCALHVRELIGERRSLLSARSKIEAHDSEIENLADQLRLLRGKFYASRRKSSEQDEQSQSEPVDPQTLKAQLRAKVGLVPGRRPQ